MRLKQVWAVLMLLADTLGLLLTFFQTTRIQIARYCCLTVFQLLLLKLNFPFPTVLLCMSEMSISYYFRGKALGQGLALPQVSNPLAHTSLRGDQNKGFKVVGDHQRQQASESAGINFQSVLVSTGANPCPPNIYLQLAFQSSLVDPPRKIIRL